MYLEVTRVDWEWELKFCLHGLFYPDQNLHSVNVSVIHEFGLSNPQYTGRL